MTCDKLNLLEENMDDHFINTIEINNFKCFHDFKAEGFGRVNLIGGKNNVGKTAFMEACYINTYSYKSLNNTSMALSDIIFNRYNQVILQDLLLEKGKHYISKEIEKKIILFNGTKIQTNIANTTLNYKEGDLGIRDKKNLTKYFLGNNPITNDKLEESYGRILELELEDKIDQLIKNIDQSIKSFRIITSEPKCNFINDSTFFDIHELGDGLYKYISILFSLFICKNSYLFIDEIDNGIHYTNLDKLWELILTISKDQNVQVFATTHSKECINSYARVAKELDDKEIRFVELGKNKNNEIKAIIMDYDRFQNELENTNEVRGW
jgi:AAA15 family ATPase/GTPase